MTINKNIELERIGKLTSPLRWAGGKRFVAREIKTFLKNSDSNDTLIEVFGGSLSLTFAIKPKQSVVNDILTPLINMFSRIKSGEIDNVADFIDISNSQENFLINRGAFNTINRGENPSSVNEAALFYFLNRTCFNGLCRFSKKTGYNVGWGKLKSPSILESFSDHKSALVNTTIHNKPFEDFHCEDKGLVILDPPYHDVFNDYSSSGFKIEDQQHLCDIYKSTTNPLIAFNSNHPDILKMYKDNGYDVFTYDAPRKISCNGARENAIEMFAVKNIDRELVMKIMSTKNIKRS